MDYTTGLHMDNNASASATDQRGAPRFTSLIRAAKLVCGQGEFVCVIRDVSATGVSLRTFHALPTDKAIALELQNGETYELEMVRSEGFDASYRFAAPISVDRLIYEDWSFPKRALRLNVMLPLTVSTLSGRSEAFTLNISQQGSRIECDQVFAIDQRVTIGCEHLPDIRCKVRWRRDANYGLVFEDTFSLREFAMFAVKIQCPVLLQDNS
ncbi:PilZ domain-containing protein [Qipengyuania qiaonensis]|uniref:PilZ domain-containing protein n=1 Tax=Qipengyuania qiaonensis TaxID=2867240 RepID=A0ABS7J350_9SPHN|nr:PilZ domain-containing protein [Qipengyuania qiaonensis]MBX7481751.1 PilZ domain-containing protein [Qipengyuania qiaonensis]